MRNRRVKKHERTGVQRTRGSNANLAPGRPQFPEVGLETGNETTQHVACVSQLRFVNPSEGQCSFLNS